MTWNPQSDDSCNVANANALKEKRDAFVRFMRHDQPGHRLVLHGRCGDRCLRRADKGATPSRLQRTRDEFYPKASLQLGEVRGLDLTLKQALEYKYITAPLSVAEVQQGLIDILYAPPK